MVTKYRGEKGPRAWGCRLGAWGLWAEGRRIFLYFSNSSAASSASCAKSSETRLQSQSLELLPPNLEFPKCLPIVAASCSRRGGAPGPPYYTPETGPCVL